MYVGAIQAPLVARAMARSKSSFPNLSQRTQVQEKQEVKVQYKKYKKYKYSTRNTSTRIKAMIWSLSQELDEDGSVLHDPVQECNDLINNRGCVKQYVNKGPDHNDNDQYIA